MKSKIMKNMSLTRWVTFGLGLVAIAASSSPAAEFRTMRCKPGTEAQVVAWQKELRSKLFKRMKIDDLVPKVSLIPFDPKEVKSWSTSNYVVKEMTIKAKPDRRIEIVLTVPKQGKGPFPAVVCIGGHGSSRFTAYTNGKGWGEHPAIDNDWRYKGFGAELAAKGYVTISTLVSEHKLYDPGRTLPGERLWDLMRCVSYLQSLSFVDHSRMGCGGLSLGGEMSMWLAAMDTRIAAGLSAGFLTYMDQMEHDHCMCWKFPGLRELADDPDIFSMIAPRPLECQNGRKEPPTQFIPSLARKAMTEIRPMYGVFHKQDNVILDIHNGGHEIDLPALLAFFDRHLKR